MGKDLWEADAAVKALYQEANDVLGYDLLCALTVQRTHCV